MRTRSPIISATLISVLVLALAAIVIAVDDPFIGTWKMNPAKSKQSGPSLKSFTMTVEAQGNSIKIVQDMVGADGNATHRNWTYKYDGKDYPITGDPNTDTNSVNKPKANTLKYVFKKNGKEVGSGQSVVSKDGKTITDVGSGKDANGQAFTYTIFLEKQ
jgi:hypothetical protein